MQINVVLGSARRRCCIAALGSAGQGEASESPPRASRFVRFQSEGACVEEKVDKGD